MNKFGDARDKEGYRGNTSTMPPNTREGKSFPGGRHRRRALTKLSARQNATPKESSPGEYRKAGSMK